MSSFKQIIKNPKLVNKSEIARKMGVTPSYVTQLLNNKNKRKNPERLKEIKKIIKDEFKAA